FTRRTALALGASLGGLVLLVTGDGGLPRASAHTALLGVLSALFYGLNTLTTKKGMEAFSAAEVLSYHCLLAAALVWIFAGTHPQAQAFVWRPLAGAALLGACGAAVFYAGLQRIPASRAAILAYLEPLVAAVVGYAAFGESLGPAALFGGALILAAG